MLSYYIFWLQSIIHAVAYSISKNNKIKRISPSLQDLNRKHLSRQYGKRVYKTIPFFQRIFCIWNRQEGSATVEAAPDPAAFYHGSSCVFSGWEICCRHG